MFFKKKKQELTEEEKSNSSYYNKAVSIQTFIGIAYVIPLFIIISLLIYYLPYDIHWFFRLMIFLAASVVFFVSGWLFAFPFRFWLYKLAKKQGLLKQDFMPWVVDWSKVLLLNLLIMAPFIALSGFVFYNFCLTTYVFYIYFFILFVTFIFLKTFQRFLSMWFIHGFYKLTDGEKFNYWCEFTKSNNIKTYPIYILTIAEKATFANAFAFGVKNNGFIYTSDQMLNDLTKKQFTAVMAHETAHLEHNDVLKRMLFFLSLIVILLSVPYLIDFIPDDFLEIFILLSFIIIFLPLVLSTIFIKRQEFNADLYSKKLLNSGEPMSEALEYLYTINKMPKDLDKKRPVSFHPSLKERQKNLLE